MYGAADLLRGYLRAHKRRRLIVPVWLPGKAARVFLAGANLAPEQSMGSGFGRSSSLTKCASLNGAVEHDTTEGARSTMVNLAMSLAVVSTKSHGKMICWRDGREAQWCTSVPLTIVNSRAFSSSIVRPEDLE